MNQYTYLFMGIILGFSLAVIFFIKREEKFDRIHELSRIVFSTDKLDKTMDSIIDNIENKIKDVRRELTEEEKNDIIVKCYKKEFEI